MRNTKPRTAEDIARAKKQRARALSTNNKGFTSLSTPNNLLGSKLSRADLYNNIELDDCDIRFERNRDTDDVLGDVSKYEQGLQGKKDLEIHLESPNGLVVTGDAPSSRHAEDLITHFTSKLRQFTIQNHPQEWALCHFSLGQQFHRFEENASLVSAPITLKESRAKRIENALFHYDKSFQIYSYKTHPVMWALVCNMMGQLFRERANLTSLRSLLAKRGSVSSTIAKGLDNLREASTVLSQHKRLLGEFTICNCELGWLYLLQYEDDAGIEAGSVSTDGIKADNAGDKSLLEIAINYLERCLSLCNDLQKQYDATENDRTRPYDPQDPTGFPAHLHIAMRGKPFLYMEGQCMSLLGRAYHFLSDLHEHQRTAYEYLSKCLKPIYMLLDSDFFVDAHLLLARMIDKLPFLVSGSSDGADDEGTPKKKTQEKESSLGFSPDSVLHLDSAVSHLQLASRSPSSGLRKTEIEFLIAQLNLKKLHHITDRLEPGQSLVKALADSDGNELMEIIELHLNNCLSRLTSAGESLH